MEGARWQHAQLRVLSEQAQAAGCAVGTASYASRSAAWARGRARVSIYNRCCFVLSVCVCARVCGCEWVCVCLRFVSFEIGGAALPRALPRGPRPRPAPAGPARPPGARRGPRGRAGAGPRAQPAPARAAGARGSRAAPRGGPVCQTRQRGQNGQSAQRPHSTVIALITVCMCVTVSSVRVCHSPRVGESLADLN